GCTNENDTVEKESSLFVSLTGDDQNPGTAAEPFQTLERAREVARGILAGGLTSDLVINIRSGTHFLTDRFLLEPQDSGNNGFRVIWRSHPNEQATLTTAERLDPDDWEPYQNGILRMPLPEGREFFTLLQEQANGDFARGHMAQEPDWDATKWDPITVPGSGSYFHTDGARMYTLDGCRSKNRFRFPDWEVSADSPDLIDPNADYRFAKVYLGHADYFFELHNIQSINFETRQIILTGSGNYYMPWDDYGGPDTNRPCQKSLDNMGFHLTNRFRLLNTLAFLDQPGEFFINPDENYLYYMPREDDDAPVIYAPRTHGLLKLEGTPSNLVRNIEIHGLKLFGTDYVGQFFGIIAANSLTQDGALIRFNNVNDSAITENTLIHSGTRGVVVTGSGNLVKGNTIHNMGASGMGVGGNFNVISHNDLAHIGELQFSARGIEHYGYDGATRSNRLEYTGYLGIAMGRRQFVSDNDVSHPLSRSTDAGGLYGYMNKDSVLLQGNTVLEHNYVHDYRQLPGFPTRALGIYLDGWGRDDLLVRNNLLMSGYWGDGNNMRVKGKSNFYLNNIFAMDQRMGASNMFASFTDEPQHISWGNMLVRNILVRLVGSSADGTRHRVYSVPGSTQDAVLKTTKFITRLNVTHSPPTKIAGPRINGSNTTSQVTWDQWQSAGHDAGSLIGDPLLVDPLNGDFRLQMDNDGLPLSPELKQIGFKPFTTVFGPKAASERFEEMHVSVVCGDNLIKGDETCDDGNTIDGDGCSSFCQVEHPAAPICGDGNVAAPEGCDDGDIFNGNGCSDTCQVETGWECTLGVEDTCIVDPISGSVTCWDPDRSFCSPICGDGLKHGVEVCDDGDTVAGDGCNDACTIELGYACIGEPSICSVACGDGIRMGTETCDDGNATPNDGCTVCSLDLGYECTTETPNTCTTVCGDGLIRGHEACDDSDEVDGDGCNSLCLAEPGYTCLAEPSACTTVCGDGLIRGVEECDDSGIIASDGCSSLCVLESGFSCTDQPSTCVTVCGDGIIAGNEQCDDSNTGDHDGCSAICATEAGFTCTAQPSDCHSICGDGLIRNGETCDDLNQTNSDGCNSLCNVEAGYSCQSEPSVCTQTIVIDCGNGMLESIETCDDGNETAGDGCSGLCQLESGWQCQVTPSQCMTVCGDNIVAGSEVCDDGTDNGTEGFCSADCTVQLPDCGNGIVAVLEHCDDGNEINNDGCSASCIEETGFDCDGEPSVCGNICGDTLLRGIELCDDGNLQPDDGCNAHCMLEEGYACNQTTLICATVCGDAIIAGGEECDDGGTTAGDGCSGNCRLESSSSSSSDSVDQSSSTTSEASSSISSGTGSSAGTETSSSTPMISSSSSSEQPIGNTVSSQPSSFSPTVFSAGSRSSVAIANVPIIDIEAAYRAQQEVIRQRIEAERQAALSSQAASSSATQWQTTSEGQVVIAEGELHGAAVAVSEDAVALLENRNVLRGQGDSRENLDLGSPVNRAETVTLLLRFFRLPEKTGDAPYFDVESYDWYAPAVVSATRSALVQGYDDGTFRPANNVTVAEAIKMIVVGAGWLPAGQGQPGEKWYQPYLEEATRRGLMDSLPAMWPNEPALRGWVAQMLVNTGL
ncbi:MAG TPA: DUF4215 domain-containing protein, partial [Candidatus Peribacteraceae bacterium]|nr:DUF4215 domain-containing protein [Candidatus Peribacteraceae bacterium]